MGRYTMLHHINKLLSVVLDDGRSIVGKLLVFDKHMNVVLANATEERPPSRKREGEGTSTKRQLGLILLRGEHVVSVTVMGDGEAGSGGGHRAADFSSAPKATKATVAKRKRE